MDGGAYPKIVAEVEGMLTSAEGQEVEVDRSHVTTRDGMDGFAERFVETVAQHRRFDREATKQMPA